MDGRHHNAPNSLPFLPLTTATTSIALVAHLSVHATLKLCIKLSNFCAHDCTIFHIQRAKLGLLSAFGLVNKSTVRHKQSYCIKVMHIFYLEVSIDTLVYCGMIHTAKQHLTRVGSRKTLFIGSLSLFHSYLISCAIRYLIMSNYIGTYQFHHNNLGASPKQFYINRCVIFTIKYKPMKNSSYTLHMVS